MVLLCAQSCCTAHTNNDAETVASKEAPVPLRALPMQYYIERHCAGLFAPEATPKAWQEYTAFCSELNTKLANSEDIADKYYGQPILPPADSLWMHSTAQHYKRAFAQLLQCMALPELTEQQKTTLEELALIHRQEWLLTQLYEQHEALLHGGPGAIPQFMMCACYFHSFRQNVGKVAAERADYDKLDAEMAEWYALWSDRHLLPAKTQLPVIWDCSNGKQEVATRFAPLYGDLPPDMLFDEEGDSYELTCETEIPANSGELYLIFPAMPKEYQITVNGQAVTPETPGHPFIYILRDNASFLKVNITTPLLDSIGVPTIPVCIGAKE